MDSGKLIRGESPGCGGPDDQRGIGLIDQWESHIDARVCDFPITLSDLACTQRRATLSPPPNDLMPSVEQTSVEEIFQRPPNAFDIALMVGHISFREIDPKAESLGDSFPLLHVAPDALLAFGDERFDTEFFNLFFGMDPELFADLDFHWQAVGIPTSLAIAPVASHGAVAREEVFDGAGKAVAGVGQTVGRRWPLIEYKRFRSLP